MKFPKFFKTMFSRRMLADEFTHEALSKHLKKLATWRPLLVTGRSSRKQVKTVHALGRLLIHGDQHNPELFPTFIEHDGVELLLSILSQRSNRRGPVAVEVLKTMSLLVHNIRDKESLSYLLSAQGIRKMIDLDLDFTDEDVRCNFACFIKGILLRLDQDNVQLFMEKDDKSGNLSMPLFTRFSELLYDEEGMIRKAMRIATLMIISTKDERIKEWLIGSENQHFYTTLATHTEKKIQDLKGLLLDQERMNKGAEIANLANDLMDTIGYISEIFTCALVEVQIQLANAVWDFFVASDLASSLFQAINDQLVDHIDGVSMGSAASDLVEVPSIDRLEKVVQQWLPQGAELDFSIFTTFLSQTLSILIQNSESQCNRVLAQAINHAFHHMEEDSSTGEEVLSVTFNSDSFLYDTATDWGQIEEDEGNFPTAFYGLMECVKRIGAVTCFRSMERLFRLTHLEKYKPCSSLLRVSRLSPLESPRRLPDPL